MHSLRQKILWRVMPTFLLLLVHQLLFTHAYLKSVRIEEIPFSVAADGAAEGHTKDAAMRGGIGQAGAAGIHAISSWEQQRGIFHVFKVPYIICFFAAKGKWPFIPPFMQSRVDDAARTFFYQNDSAIRQFCQKWIQIKECFRPIFGSASPNSEVERVGPIRSTPCTCTNEPQIYFDRDHIGNVGRDTILNTIEFLENFLESPQTNTRKTKKKKNRVRSRLDEINIDE